MNLESAGKTGPGTPGCRSTEALSPLRAAVSDLHNPLIIFFKNRIGLGMGVS